MATASGLIVAYVVGGFTFFPVVLLIVYIVHKVSAMRHWTLVAYEGVGKAASKTSTSTQSYKVGWLRVSRDEQRLPPPDASIGDMVKNIIINRSSDENNIYFAVLKHTTLFLYDSEKQLDCKGVIQVNQHSVVTHPPGLQDHELFTRPHLIKLTHKDNKESHYYINCSKCIDKEDWYLALLRAARPPDDDEEQAMHFDQDAMNQLLKTIHSDEHHFQTQWFNAMLGRIFCATYKTDLVNSFLYNKLISKLDKLNARRPAFLGEITVRSVNPGHAPPFLTQPRLLGLSPTGELTAEADLQYEGGIRFEIETVLKWKYYEHLRPLTVDLVLAITLKSLRGKFLLKIKEPPTNRLWYGFYELPKMEWLVEPLVWERRVGYSMVVKAIQTKIDELVMENVVLPNLDDITFFPTNGVGAIFRAPPNPGEPLVTVPNDKPKMRRWFTSKEPQSVATEPVIHPPPRPTMMTSVSDSAREEKRSFIDAILNRKPPKPQHTSSFASSEPTGVLSSSPGSISSSASSSNDDSSSSSLSQHNSTSPKTMHTLPIPIITTDVEQYDSDHDHETLVRTGDSQLRLRKSASLARLKAKTMASTAVSQINVSPTMHKAELVVDNSDATTVMSSMHQPNLNEKPVVSIA
ncbi:putative integral membrane protein conserved region-domain-containing protein [Fennellomyces sp. T-0311]|nr:putative integral membrane protein conserved region-domain-containing protein [Fennellomyces sp. T-0311]